MGGILFKFNRFCEWTMDFNHFLDKKMDYDTKYSREEYLFTREFAYRYVKSMDKLRKQENDQICFPKPLKYKQTDSQIFEERYKIIENSII